MHGKKIIIAEASSTIKGVADSLLRQHGYDVVCTSDGLQAWEVIQAERPDLALIGLNLSGISGLELCRQMSGDRIAGGIPSMLLIGAKDNVSKDDLMSSGAQGHLKKPFSPKDLLGAVSKLIGPGDNAVAQDDSARNTTRTSYNSEILSTTRHLEGEPQQVHNVNWTDIAGTGKVPSNSPRKVAGLNVDSDDPGLPIEEDQFGLISGRIKSEAPQQKEARPDDDEDYNWFIGEMKREVEGGGKTAGEAAESRDDRPSLRAAAASEDELKFVDLGMENREPVKNGAAGVVKGKGDSGGRADLGGSRKILSDSDIEKIAERITQKLALSIAARIDRKTLIDAIRSSLNS